MCCPGLAGDPRLVGWFQGPGPGRAAGHRGGRSPGAHLALTWGAALISVQRLEPGATRSPQPAGPCWHGVARLANG